MHWYAAIRCYERMWVSYYVDDFPKSSVGVRFQFPNSIGCSPNLGRRSRTFLILSFIRRRTNEVPPSQVSVVVPPGPYESRPFLMNRPGFPSRVPPRYLTICRALVDPFIAVEFTCLPTQGSPFPSRVVEVLMLQTAHIPSSRR